MNFLKTTFVILASVMLVGTQTVFAVQPVTPTKSQVCGCCACKKMDCCVAQPTSVPQPVPASPVRTVSQDNLQIIAAVVSMLLPDREKIAEPISFAPFSSLHIAHVPLYEWNCSYLI